MVLLKVLKPILGIHAQTLYPLIKNSPVTDNLLWDGPENLSEYEKGLKQREKQVADGELHMFTVIDPATGLPCGTADIRNPDDQWSIGYWIGENSQGKGLGTLLVADLLAYGFDTLAAETIIASVFVGNHASRKVLENNKFTYIETLKDAVIKKGASKDEWLFKITSQEYRA
jgi:RimJ/RimL family protein N-acetyltransferase